MALKFGDATTDRVTTAFGTHSVKRSWSIWARRTGLGGSSVGRMWDKNKTSSSEVLQCGTTAYSFARHWSVADGVWSVGLPSANVWHHIVVCYDASLTTNDPVIYVDGVSKTVTRTGTPSGGLTGTTDPYCVGNRPSDNARNWAGDLAYFAINDVILTPAEVLDTMLNGFTPRALRVYLPLTGGAFETDYGPTGSAARVMGVKPATTSPPVVPPAGRGLPARVR